jgi:hypothetical protein
VDATTSGTGVIGFIQTVAANEEVQALGKTILDGVPALMSTLETLTDVHPFLKGVLSFPFLHRPVLTPLAFSRVHPLQTHIQPGSQASRG